MRLAACNTIVVKKYHKALKIKFCRQEACLKTYLFFSNIHRIAFFSGKNFIFTAINFET